MPIYEPTKILIWTKTGPEISSKHIETVCTAGVLEDGKPIRIYPIPFRYLDESQRFKKYQWIRAGICKSTTDTRPESYKINHLSIQLDAEIPPDKYGWEQRASFVFSNKDWQFGSMEELVQKQADMGVSLGVVAPKVIARIHKQRRPPLNLAKYKEKRESVRKWLEVENAQPRLFDDYLPPSLKDLQISDTVLKVDWFCHGKQCSGHSMQVLDWELVELARKAGEEKAVQKLNQILDLKTHAVRFFMGNMWQHPASFSIIGIWYPLHGKAKQPSLFD